MFYKGAYLIFSFVFQNFQRFWYHKIDHIFLITFDKFNTWKVFCLEDNNENVHGYDNHNWAWDMGNCNIQIASYIQMAWQFQLKF